MSTLKMLKLSGEFTTNLCVVRRLVFASSALPSDTPHFWETVSSFASVKSCSLTPEKAKAFIENMRYMEPESFCLDQDLATELHSHIGNKGVSLGIVLISPNSCCKFCGSQLLVKADRPSRLTVYSDTYGTVPGTSYRKICKSFRTGCHFVQHYGCYSNGVSDMCYDDSALSLPYFMCTRETAIEMTLLNKLDAEILIGQLSYKQKSDIFNIHHHCDNAKKKKHTVNKESQKEANENRFVDKSDRQSLDRRRLEDAHIQYAILTVCSWYPGLFRLDEMFFTTKKMDELVVEFMKVYHKAFSAKYAGHKCKYPGCQRVLVLDGNMKNRRDVCMAREAGYTTYDGLPGGIKTGCMNTPEFKSRHCSVHLPRACVPYCSSEEKKDDDSPQRDEHRDGIVEQVLEKRVTRNATYYKVLWIGKEEVCASWVHEKSLTAEVIQEYETSTKTRVAMSESSQNGLTTYTASIEKIQSGDPPAEKQSKRERYLVSSATGPLSQSQRDNISCNTEKDRDKKLNHHTAGILAGIWPCGIITMLSELYIAESKSQVYGAIHDYIHCNETLLQDLCFICYDDGCHLRKFASNPVRKDLTPTTKKIASMKIMVDKMHIAGHKDKWCLDNCDSRKCPDLDCVDTEVCEQTFSWLSRYKKITRRMNKTHFMFYILYICDMHNRREIMKLENAGYM